MAVDTQKIVDNAKVEQTREGMYCVDCTPDYALTIDVEATSESQARAKAKAWLDTQVETEQALPGPVEPSEDTPEAEE